MSSILIIQFGFNFLNLKNMYLENYILKMIRHQTVKNRSLQTHFFLIEKDRPIVVTLYNDVVMLQRAQGGCLGTESR